jgi:hypothetical protein
VSVRFIRADYCGRADDCVKVAGDAA